MNGEQALKNRFDQHLQDYLESLPADALHEPMRYVMDLGGKRIRPLLVLMAAQAFDGDESQALQAALAVEIFHNFSLVHDDIMDAAPLRRGQATVHKRYSSNTAILSGDAMLIEAYRQLSAAAPAKLTSMLQLFNRTAMEVCQGQQLDMDFENRREVSRSEYLEMIRLKTAVLLGCSLELGAMTGCATAEQRLQINTFGQEAGIAFQIQDDYLDTFGQSAQFGKVAGGDIDANKKTFLFVEACAHASAAQRSELLAWYGASDTGTAAKRERVKELFTDTGAAQAAITAVDQYTERALAALAKLGLPDYSRSGLESFLQLLSTRTH